MITFLLLVAWGFYAVYCPKILYGYSWKQLKILSEDKTLQTTSELLKELGIVDENITQISSKRYFTCIATVILTLVLVFIIRKLLNFLDQYLKRVNKLGNVEIKQKIKELKQPTRTAEENIAIINKLSYLDDESVNDIEDNDNFNDEFDDDIEDDSDNNSGEQINDDKVDNETNNDNEKKS